MSNQPRKPKGTPVGGQFDRTLGGGPAAVIDDSPAPGKQSLATEIKVTDTKAKTSQRALRLLSSDEGFRVEKLRGETSEGNASWKRITPTATWSKRSKQLRPSRATKGVPYLKAGDKTFPFSFVTYSGAGVKVNMPSASAARRFADKQKARPAVFDMPVAVQNQKDGKIVNCWVRVAKSTKPTRWEAVVLDGKGELSAGLKNHVSASVLSVVESRKKKTSLTEHKAVSVTKRRKAAQRGTALKPVRSAAIAALGYDKENHILYITHHSRFRERDNRVVAPTLYAYEGVSEAKYNEFRQSDSLGRALPEVKKGTHAVKAEFCDKCHRAYTHGTKHICPITA